MDAGSSGEVHVSLVWRPFSFRRMVTGLDACSSGLVLLAFGEATRAVARSVEHGAKHYTRAAWCCGSGPGLGAET